MPQNEKWGRTYEGFGETAEINQMMGIASVVGLQGNDLALDNTILACAKHFIGDGGTTDGIDQGDTDITEQVLRSLHMPAYVDAIEQGLKKGKVKDPSQARLTLGQAYFELQNFEQAKKEFRIAARDDDKKIKKTANSWIKYTENEEIRVKNIALRRDYIQNQG